MKRQVAAQTEAQSVTDGEIDAFLVLVGGHVRAKRTGLGLSRRALSEISGVSPRYLAQIEGGHGNISIVLLKRISHAMSCKIEELFASEDRPGPNHRASRFALIGMRGAGKSTLGRRAATHLGRPFVELTQQIETIGGMGLNEVFSLSGQEGYRRLEYQALTQITTTHSDLILAVSGGIVAKLQTFDYLLTNYTTIWLKALPSEHMARVRAQGDLRPMTGNPDAMRDLSRILSMRETSYRRANSTLDTSGATEDQSLRELLKFVT